MSKAKSHPTQPSKVASKKSTEGPVRKLIASNKKAYHEYIVHDTYFTGIVLLGTEIKSIRQGKVSMVDAFAKIERGEIFLYGLNITPYEKASHFNHEATRIRKLLLNKSEIAKIETKLKQSGWALVPTKLVMERCWLKVELGLCQGKKLHDKRDAIAERDVKLSLQRTLKQIR
jgi:SsrA-binding protein